MGDALACFKLHSRLVLDKLYKFDLLYRQVREGDEVATGLNSNRITQRLKLNHKVALITGNLCKCQKSSLRFWVLTVTLEVPRITKAFVRIANWETSYAVCAMCRAGILIDP